MADTILYAEFNDSTRTVTTRDGTGTVIGTRAYDAQENTDADSRASADNNEQTLTTNAKNAISVLGNIVTDLQTIAAKAATDITGADTIDIANQLVRVTKQVARVTRLCVQAYDAAL